MILLQLVHRLRCWIHPILPGRISRRSCSTMRSANLRRHNGICEKIDCLCLVKHVRKLQFKQLVVFASCLSHKELGILQLLRSRLNSVWLFLFSDFSLNFLTSAAVSEEHTLNQQRSLGYTQAWALKRCRILCRIQSYHQEKQNAPVQDLEKLYERWEGAIDSEKRVYEIHLNLTKIEYKPFSAVLIVLSMHRCVKNLLPCKIRSLKGVRH